MKKVCIFLCCIPLTLLLGNELYAQNSFGEKKLPLKWKEVVLVEALSPEFYKKVDSDNMPVLGIATGAHKNLHGYWQTSVPVKGGKYYRFSVTKRIDNIKDGKRTPVNIIWKNSEGKPVQRDKDYASKRFALETFPADSEYAWRAREEIPYREVKKGDGTIEVSSVFQVPSNADHAIVQLHLRYCENAKVEWSGFSMAEVDTPATQKVKVASVFLPPDNRRVSTPREATALFFPHIKEAADKGAKLVCLPEWLTKAYTGLSVEEVAEQIPGGPSTGYFTDLAKKHDLYIVAGLVERHGDTLFNTAILVGPEGYVGKYRKTGLTLGEANTYGLTPGVEYPVFDTNIGRIGMMICYDIYFPQVARNLSRKGAQIIAMPIAGGNPVLAQARAIENQVYLITSTYSQRNHWLKTAIFDYDGKMLGHTDTPGSLAIAELEISELPKYWAHLGNLKADLIIQAPLAK